jgi:hypothetical protein
MAQGAEGEELIFSGHNAKFKHRLHRHRNLTKGERG